MAKSNISREDLEKRSNAPIDPAYRSPYSQKYSQNSRPYTSPLAGNKRPKTNTIPPSSRNFARQKPAYPPKYSASPKEDSEMKKVIKFAILIAIFLGLISGGIYVYTEYFMDKDGEEETERTNGFVSPDNPVEDEDEEEVKPPDPTSQIPEDEEYKKYIVIKSGENPMEKVKNYFKEIKKGDKIVEIAFIDSRGEKIDLKKFANLVGINIPKKIQYRLSDEYYFILTPILNKDKNNYDLSLGIIFASVYLDPKSNLKNMKNWWEETLISDVENFLFYYDDFQIENKENLQFADSAKYEDARYVNFPGLNDVSLNYFVYENKIVLVNNFTAMDGVMEYIEIRSETEEGE